MVEFMNDEAREMRRQQRRAAQRSR